MQDVYEVFTCRITTGSLQTQKSNSVGMPGSADIRGCAEKTDLVPLKCPTTPLVDSIVDLSHLLLAINSSANVIIYTLRGKLNLKSN